MQVCRDIGVDPLLRYSWPMQFFRDEIETALGRGSSRGAGTDHIAQAAYPSCFKVTELALASTEAAVLEYAALVGAQHVSIDQRLALLWFHFTTQALGWTPAPSWDAVAGDYQCADGWVRLHTNAPHHLNAAMAALGTPVDRDAVAARLRDMGKAEVEDVVVANNGCAAAMYRIEEWANHPQGKAVAKDPLMIWSTRSARREFAGRRGKNLSGLRVLDLTRVLAGPVATRFLAGFGAEVLRIDPPHWNEPAVELEVTLGKRCAGLDLRQQGDRLIFDELVRRSDVFVHGYRADALARLGYDTARLESLNPDLISISLCAYGWQGPWATRRGFDSLVQMSCGIADEGMRRAGRDHPVPLPVQALDFATGHLMAAAALRALARREEGVISSVRLSLARTAHLLISGGTQPIRGENPTPEARDFEEKVELTSWGAVKRLTPPYRVDGCPPCWEIPAGALRGDPAEWPAVTKYRV